MKGLHIVCCLFSFLCVSALKYNDYRHFLEDQSRNSTFVKLFDQHIQRFQTKYRKITDFPCEPFKLQKKATNVHELTPSDVKVIGAIGDSLTAGTGITARTPIGLLRQDRGLSWSVGGDGTAKEYITLANMLKRYNPDLVGFSVGSGDYESENAHLNVADPGNESRDMPFQARLLVDRMKSGKEGVDFENDWKVITMFIGGNDLCDYCDDKIHVDTPLCSKEAPQDDVQSDYTAEKYIGRITEALDIFHAEVPKAFVNVVETLNVANIPLLNDNLICDTLHYFTCRCGAFPGSDENKKEIKELVVGYQKALRDLAASGRYDTRDDFTVVDQPFFSDTQIPVTSDGSPDLKYFAPDCFHFSELGQEATANALWDNMIEPVGLKRNFWRPGVPVECPNTDQPYFFTKKNSPPLKGFGFQESDTRDNTSDNISGSTIAGVITGVICLMFVVVGSLYYFKARSSTAENDYLLLQRSSSTYTKI